MGRDDEQVGRTLSRREVLSLLGLGGAAVLGGAASLEASAKAEGVSSMEAAGAGAPSGAAASFRLPACVVRPEQTEGPYFVETGLNRSDIRSDPTDGSVREGAPLQLTVQLSRVDADGCRPLPGALVDLWQCDAMGVYSGVEDISGSFDTSGKQFLRGHQRTDESGAARFVTIYPGWYQGRTVHVHFKIRTEPDAESGHEFTSQLYFDDALTDRVHARSPYAAHEGERTRNGQDAIFGSGGDQLLLDVSESGGVYRGTFDVGLQVG